jgi:hypothetical protein
MKNGYMAAGLLAVALAAAPGAARAQGGSISPQCPAGDQLLLATQDACQKAVDIFQFMAPQLGVMLTGGNAVLGEARSLGGLGHVSLGIRANALRGRLPQVDEVSTSVNGAVASTFPVDDQIIGLPAVDAAIGIVSGLDLGGITILGVDGLVNLAYVPEVSHDDFSIDLPDGSLKVGLGARLTIFDERSFLPSVSVSFLERDLPAVNILARSGDDELTLNALDVTTSAWRAVLGKTLGPVTLVVGTGRDSYDAGASIDVTVNEGPVHVEGQGIDVSQELSRTTLFADLSLNLAMLKLVAEVGRVSGGTVTTYNGFGDARADDDLTFASVGLRLRW